ncbi:MAG: hypothetical protein CUN52_06420 [Phototrophicales bacterium]|nr:MAG: hypothetical protein CUN52_06420 [Phototrophicales bacterium]
MASFGSILAGFGMMAIAILLMVLGLLSRRLGRVTRSNRYYGIFFMATILMLIGVGGRFWVFIHTDTNSYDNLWWIMIYNGAPALGLTLGVIVAWHYWSWLLAERD